MNSVIITRTALWWDQKTKRKNSTLQDQVDSIHGTVLYFCRFITTTLSLFDHHRT